MIKTYLTTLYRAFFSPVLYADVIRRRKGTGALYLLFLSFFIGLLLCARLMITITQISQADIDYILNQIPIIEIKSGELSTDVDRPYDITLRNGNTIIRFLDDIVLDTVRQDHKDIPLIVTSREILIVKNKGTNEMRVHSLSEVEDLMIDQSTVRNFWQQGKWTLPLIALPFISLGLWIGYFVQILVIALISYVVTAFMKEEFIYETRLRMSAIAFTPVLIVNQLSEIILHHKMNFVMMAALATLYIYVMIKTSRQVN